MAWRNQKNKIKCYDVIKTDPWSKPVTVKSMQNVGNQSFSPMTSCLPQKT